MIYRILVAMSMVGFLTTSCSAPENRHILPPAPSLRPSAQASPAMNPAQASAPPQASNSPRPTTSPELPASQSASFSPQYLDTFPLGASASKLFQVSTPTGNQVAWQNRQGNLNIYQQGTQFQEVYFTPTLSHPTFVAGVWRPAGKSLLMVREEEPTGNPDYDYPINSRAITLEDGKTINNRTFQKFQVHSLEMDDKGNGYMLLSDEYPRPGTREDTRPVTSFYYSRVEQYIPSEPQMLFQTNSVSLFGKRNTLDSVIDQHGSGFFIHRNSAGQMILHSFSHLKVDPEAQSLNLPYAYDYSLSKSADGYVLTCFYEQAISSTNRNTKQYMHLQPIKDNRFMSQSYSFELPNKTKLAERKAYVTMEGNGILAGIIHNRESKKDTIILDEIREFKLISTRQYDYPKYLTLYDINLSLDELGNGKIFFEDVICSNQLCNSSFFELGKDPLQVSYVSLRNFALQ